MDIGERLELRVFEAYLSVSEGFDIAGEQSKYREEHDWGRRASALAFNQKGASLRHLLQLVPFVLALFREASPFVSCLRFLSLFAISFVLVAIWVWQSSMMR